MKIGKKILRKLLLRKRKMKLQLHKSKSKKKIQKWMKKNKMSKTTLSNQLQNKLARKTTKKKSMNILRHQWFILKKEEVQSTLVLSVNILKLNKKVFIKMVMLLNLTPTIIKNKQLKVQILNQEAVIPMFNTNVATVQSSSS